MDEMAHSKAEYLIQENTMEKKTPATTHPASGHDPAKTLTGGSLAGKYLTFKLANEEYGIGILQVREINGLMEITPVPRMSEWVRGVINLRGKVIPVLDLRLRFGFPQIQDTKQTCIIVVDVKCQDFTTLVGILVDTVSEVVNIADAEVDRAVNFGASVNNSFILGAAKVKGGVKILLDMEKILSGEELMTFTRLS